MPAVAARTGLRRVPWWAWAVVGIAVVVGLVAALGGFADAPIQKVPTIALGSAYHGQQVDARVTDARVVGVSPTGERPPAGRRWLQLDAEGLDTADRPVPVGAISLRTIVGPLDGSTAADRVLSHRGTGAISEFQPGVRTPISFLWAVPTGSVRPGDRIVVGLFEATPVEGPTVLLDQYGPPDVKVRLVFEVAS